MVPGHDFLKYINADPTPGPSSIEWYSLAGTKSELTFNGITVPQLLLNLMFKLIPADAYFSASIDFSDITNLLPNAVAISYVYQYSNYKATNTLMVSWGLTNPDENWVSFTFVTWPDNDGVVNTYSARNTGSTIYTYYLNHNEIHSSSTAKNRVESIVTS